MYVSSLSPLFADAGKEEKKQGGEGEQLLLSSSMVHITSIIIVNILLKHTHMAHDSHGSNIYIYIYIELLQ